MQRYFSRAYLRDDGWPIQKSLDADMPNLLQRLGAGTLWTLSLYRFGPQLFLYHEACGGAQPRELLPSLEPALLEWPSDQGRPRTWANMTPVYLAAMPPADAAPWREPDAARHPRGMLLRLKPDMVSSYVYWHYLRQEEARWVENKHVAIALHENFLFYYDELPPIAASRRGAFHTRRTPADWDALMEPHFLYWEDVAPEYKRKRPLECLISL